MTAISPYRIASIKNKIWMAVQKYNGEINVYQNYSQLLCHAS